MHFAINCVLFFFFILSIVPPGPIYDTVHASSRFKLLQRYGHPCFPQHAVFAEAVSWKQNTIVAVVNKLIPDFFGNSVNIYHDIYRRVDSLGQRTVNNCQLAFLNDLINLHFHQKLINILPTS